MNVFVYILMQCQRLEPRVLHILSKCSAMEFQAKPLVYE